MFRAGVNVGVDLPVGDAAARVRRHRALRRRRRRARPAGARARARRHPLRGRLPDPAEPPLRRRRDSRRSADRPPPASASSSSAAATPAPTAWAPRTGRARCRCTSSSCCRARPSRGRPDNPWPQWPRIFRSSSAHEEGGERLFSISTERFVGDDHGPGAGAGDGQRRSRAVRHHQAAGHRSDASRPIWCCWRWASSVPSAAACSPSSASG